jgi:pimeloyl-ACP methyl ester carboxylesterase
MRRVAAALLLLFGLVACSDEKTFKIDAAEVYGPGTLGLSAAGEPVRGLVVYFHGSDQDAGFIRDSEKHRAFFDPLLRAGYAVVASDADGNAYGNPVSREDYRQLIAAAQRKYAIKPTFFVAESMGALAALALMREDTGRQVMGMVGITPMMGIPPSIRSVDFIASTWGGHITDAADPMSWPPQKLADRAMRLYVAPDDKVLPPGTTGRDFADRFRSVAEIEVVDCTGGHVAVACYQGDDVQKWMASLSQTSATHSG